MLAAVGVLSGILATAGGRAAAFGDCAASPNEIVCENAKTGNPESDWQIAGVGDSTIQGFATRISVDQGQTVDFKIDTDAAAYHVDIFRLGYYDGNGARLVATVEPSVALPQDQPSCVSEPATGLVDCGNWSVSASWTVPGDAASGIYLARPEREDTGGASHIVFVVRDDDGRSDLLVQTADTTWQAYNRYGGNSLYTGSPAGRAYKASYNRPFVVRDREPYSWLFSAEYPMVRWLEANGYDVSYTTGVDTASRGAELLEHKAFVSSGHDEYWSAEQRTNVEAARDAGVHLAFFSGNEIFWKTRWEPSIDAASTPWRTMVSYKESQANAKIDPSPIWTGTWRDPRFSPPSDGGRPENALTGTIFTVNAFRRDQLVVPAADGKMRFWRNTDIAALAPGEEAALPAGILGYEWDEDLDNGFRPPGLIHLSTSTYNVSTRIVGYGGKYNGVGPATHHLTLYRASSGALVFGAGTVQWAWGLDSDHDNSGTAHDDRARQATVNLFADMGVQPAALQPGLQAATASTDSTPPSSTIAAPAPSSEFARGEMVTIRGTAVDSGGQVGGVEVSTDGGATWHAASGRGAWSYIWRSSGFGSVTIKSRAVDDSGNIETPSSGISVDVGDCPCTIWDSSATPATPSDPNGQPYELGVRFRADVGGFVKGIRFYKGAGNTGKHDGSLWTNAGQLLASATFTDETPSGWQEVRFSSPVVVRAGRTYIASYFAPAGHFAVDRSGFAAAGVDSPPLRALADGIDGPNGVYRSGSSGFPTSTYQGSNYWVDVVFDTVGGSDSQPPTVVGTTPAASATDVPGRMTLTAELSEAVDPTSVTTTSFELRDAAGAPVAARVSADGQTLKLTPQTRLGTSETFTARVRGGVDGVSDLGGNPLAEDYSWSFTTRAEICPCTIWDSATVPPIPAQADSGAYELGVKFRSDLAGYVKGVRFYKGPGNAGTHVGRLWSATGQLLASATFTNETASGWQEVELAAPVAVSATTTYIVSYHAPNGHYALARPGFAPTGVEAAPLTALADGVDGPNGVYKVGASGFPSSSYQASNYWVDVVFDTVGDTRPPTVAGVAPAAGAVDVPVGSVVTVQMSEPVDPASVSGSMFELRNSGGGLVAATVSVSGDTLTLQPQARLASGETFTALLRGGASGVKDTFANPLAADHGWSFATKPAQVCPCSLWASSMVPTITASVDGGSYELGVRFRSEQAGFVKGVRFYKGTGNSGTHVGRLWSATGQLLASATFTNETASGWQEVEFGSPVAITANTAYVVSYTAPAGRYSLDRPYFISTYYNPPLSADGGSNGLYGTPGSFPTGSYQQSNYWVDVVFDAVGDTRPPTVASMAPAAGSGDVPVGSAVTARMSEPVDPASVSGSTFELRNSGGGLVSATVAVSGDTLTLRPQARLTSGETYAALVRGGVSGVKDLFGNPLAADHGWSFTTRPPQTCPCSLWPSTTVPTISASVDGGAYELGVRFRSESAGFVTGVRFYKGTGNSGTHVGRLWSATGQLLASATFTNESATGWQEVAFSSPVAIAANTAYVVSYTAPVGRYSLDRPYFTSAYYNPPLSADGGSNGLYGTPGSFPTGSYQQSNYWVDVVFVR